MGRSKADLPWHGSTLLYRTAALLVRTLDGPVVVVRAPGQPLPALPAWVAVTDDPVTGLGPMQGVAAGLAAVAGSAEQAFVCSTDLPFLHPAFVRRVLRELAEPDVDAVFPVARGFRQPLAAGYRTAIAAVIDRLLAEGGLRPGMLLARCRVAQPDDAALLADPELALADPGLESVTNVNTPEDYAAALSRPAPEVLVELAGLARRVRAATLAEAAAAVAVPLAGLAVTLNGEPVDADGGLPLVAGDRVDLVVPDRVASRAEPVTPL